MQSVASGKKGCATKERQIISERTTDWGKNSPNLRIIVPVMSSSRTGGIVGKDCWGSIAGTHGAPFHSAFSLAPEPDNSWQRTGGCCEAVILKVERR